MTSELLITYFTFKVNMNGMKKKEQSFMWAITKTTVIVQITRTDMRIGPLGSGSAIFNLDWFLNYRDIKLVILQTRQIYGPQHYGSSFSCYWFQRHASRVSNYSHVWTGHGSWARSNRVNYFN